jgi:hypothetical protein
MIGTTTGGLSILGDDQNILNQLRVQQRAEKSQAVTFRLRIAERRTTEGAKEIERTSIHILQRSAAVSTFLRMEM